MDQHAASATAYIKSLLSNGNRNNGFHDDEDLLAGGSLDHELDLGPRDGNFMNSVLKGMEGSPYVGKHHVKETLPPKKHSQSATSSPYISNYRIPRVHNHKNHSSQNNTPTKSNYGQQFRQALGNNNQNKASLHGSLSHIASNGIDSHFGHVQKFTGAMPASAHGSPYRSRNHFVQQSSVVATTSLYRGNSSDFGISEPEDNGQEHASSSSPASTDNKSMWTALYDYDAQGEDELSLRRGEMIQVLSKDAKVSGDEGWWTGKKIGSRVGIFPANFVAHSANFLQPLEVDYDDLELEVVIGRGGFGSVWRGQWRGDVVAVKKV
ncbi:unnamed protein product, partial [Allacma fusca]